METGPVAVCGKEERDNTGGGAPSNRPVGLGNQSPWSGEPWANHWDQGKLGKCPESWDSCEVSAGVRADPESPGSRAGVHVGSSVSGTWGNVETVAPWPPAAGWTTPKYICETSGCSSP